MESAESFGCLRQQKNTTNILYVMNCQNSLSLFQTYVDSTSGCQWTPSGRSSVFGKRVE